MNRALCRGANQPVDPVRLRQSGCAKALIGFFEDSLRVFEIKRALLQCLWIPFAPWDSKEVATVNVDGGRDLFEGIRYRVDNRFTERKSVFRHKRLIPMSSQPGFSPTIKSILFSAAIDAYDRPHAMIVRIQIHARSPEHVKDRQLF